mgnify:CR=1 FL=1
MLNLRVVQPSLLIDLRHIEELRTFKDEKDHITLGACVTHAQIEDGAVPDPTAGFLREVAGTDPQFRLEEFHDTMRSRVVSVFSDALASAKIPVLDVATRYTELGEALLQVINPDRKSTRLNSSHRT